VSLRPAAALAAACLFLSAFLADAAAQTQPPAQPRPQPPSPAKPPAPPPAPAKPSVAVLQGLDKITARVTAIKAPLGQGVRFGTLEIQAKACDKRPPEEPPESAAYLEIRELRPGEPPAKIFAGWMFASSPALSALEHPVYDVSVVDCQ
jgi:hypothetical protein